MSKLDFKSHITDFELERLSDKIPIRHFGLLKQGRNWIYLLESEKSEKYILKIFTDARRFAVEAEILQSSFVQSLAITPECFFALPPRVLIYKYLDGRVSLGGKTSPNFVYDGPFLSNPKKSIEIIVDILIKIQQLSTIASELQTLNNNTLNPIRNKSLISRAINYRPEAKSIITKLASTLSKYERTISYDDASGISHGDFRPHHVLVDANLSDPKIIDWECATKGNINIDIATLILTIHISSIELANTLVYDLMDKISEKVRIQPNLINYYAQSIALSWVIQDHLSDKSIAFLNEVVNRFEGRADWFNHGE